MKCIALLATLLITATAGASSLMCMAEKSLVMRHPETGKIILQRAQTFKFAVTDAEHEAPKTLTFTLADGKSWGEVTVATGSNKAPSGNTFYVNATVTKPDGTIAAQLGLRGPSPSAELSATTFIFDNGDFPPTLTLRCQAMAEGNTPSRSLAAPRA